jgi:hypothetical protein
MNIIVMLVAVILVIGGGWLAIVGLNANDGRMLAGCCIAAVGLVPIIFFLSEGTWKKSKA